MALQLNAAAGRPFGLSTAGWALDLLMVMDDDAVVLDRGDRVLVLLAVGIELRSLEIDVISLPGQRREAHVHLRSNL